MFKFFITALFSLWLGVAPAQAPRSITLQVDGLVCAFCAQGIEKKLGALPESDGVYVNLEHGLVALGLKPAQDLPDAALKATLTDAGYTVKSIRRTGETLAQIKAAHQGEHTP